MWAWSEAHEDVVAAADQTVTEGLTWNTVGMLEGFPTERALLSLLADQFGDGPT